MLNYGIQLVTGPFAEPVSLPIAKAHLRVEFSDDDGLILALITAAREYVEHAMNRAIFNQTWALTLDCFPSYGIWPTASPTGAQDATGYWTYIDSNAIKLPRPRTSSIVSITYVDSTGKTQSLDPSTLLVDTSSEPARIVPANGSWPYPGVYIPGSVKVTFITGTYGDGTDPSTCPASISQAILLLIGHWYANREAVAEKALVNLPLAVDALLSPFKFHNLSI